MTIKELNTNIEMYLGWEKHFMELGLYTLADETSDTVDTLIQERYALEKEVK